MSVSLSTLQQFDVFSGLTGAELESLAHMCREERYDEDDCVILEGGKARSLYLTLEGKISLNRTVQLGRSGSSRQATVSILGPGRAFGWSCLVPPYTYTGTGVCLGPVSVLAIDGSELREYMDRNPETGLKLMIAVAVVIQERMEATTNTLTYFLSIIAHELKSPIAAVENYLQVMLGGFSGDLNPRQTKMLERCALRVKDLRNLISDILDLARMKPENIEADFEWLNPVDICEDAVENVRLSAQESGIKMKISLQPEFQPIVGARRRLRQVLTNLLSNAIKFSPEGGVVTIRVWEEPENLIAEVTDEGAGIQADEQEHIFQDFFRGKNAEGIAGTGMGLSIAKKIVEVHRGKIGLESPYEEGKPGTKFTVAIPRNLATPNMKREQWKSAHERGE